MSRHSPGLRQTALTPSVPASTVAVQNNNPAPVTVVITGGTMTAVIINGITAGTGAGTYTVPPAGAISMTYSVAPTWAWSAAGAAPAADFQARLPKGSVVYADSTAGRHRPAAPVPGAQCAERRQRPPRLRPGQR